MNMATTEPARRRNRRKQEGASNVKTENKLPPIKVKLVETNVYTRWPCTVCSGCTGKVAILAESEDDIRVCEKCLKEGVEARLQEHIRKEIEFVEFLRSLVGRLNVPTYEAWEKAMKENYENDIKRDERLMARSRSS
jgi:hypothetical protein